MHIPYLSAYLRNKVAMASHNNTIPHWEAPRFCFVFPHQSEAWKVFYIRALDYLKALNIDTDEADESRTSWKQLKMMFEMEDR